MASLRAHVLNTVIRLASKRRLAKVVLTPDSIAAMRRRMDRLGDRLKLPPTLSRHDDDLNGVKTEWTRVHGERRGVIFYCHGGGYFVGSPRVYRGMAARLATLTRCDVAVIDYRLAPEHVYPAAPDDALLAYRAVLARAIDPSSLVIVGDSAGGNLALVTLLRARDRGLPLPSAGVLLSPWTDLTGSGASMRSNERRDPMLPAHRIDDAARMYAPLHEPADPDLSPLFADLSGLPPLSIHVGSTEILLDDARRLAKQARTHGVEATVKVWSRMPHVFPMFADFIPEGRQALSEIQEFIGAHLLEQSPAAAAR
jgi:acetyl esterase/lipase